VIAPGQLRKVGDLEGGAWALWTCADGADGVNLGSLRPGSLVFIVEVNPIEFRVRVLATGRLGWCHRHAVEGEEVR